MLILKAHLQLAISGYIQSKKFNTLIGTGTNNFCTLFSTSCVLMLNVRLKTNLSQLWFEVSSVILPPGCVSSVVHL